MLKSKTTTDKYKVNEKTQLTIKNAPIMDEEGSKLYRVELSLKHKAFKNQPLTFEGSDDIADFIGNIDYDEEQQKIV